ncbi:MAG: methionyl-tRNA formyltransferase [Bifidobacteriaceae bacterium]|jgi:methionyl-tRNA formyltransferase|nr:methionyl-tRNA formyltransferase [Bifidobacteriaceae bacterium]
MRIVFAGTPAPAIPALEALAASGHELVGAISRPDRPSGRGRRPSASPVAQAAGAMGLAVLKPNHPRDPDFQEALRQLAPDAVAVVAYGALLPESALAITPLGWINLHFSLLPAWRGAAPVQRSIWAGDEFTGATTFQIVKELDAGPVFGVVTYRVPAGATSGRVFQDLAAAGARLLVTTMDLIESGEARPRPQSSEGISYAPKVTVAEAEVDWSAPPAAVGRQIRACTPAPGAWTTFRGQRLKLGPVGPDVEAAGRRGPVGSVIALKRDVLVLTGGGPVRLGQVAPAGKSWMDAAAWARGLRIDGGRDDNWERFGR